MSFQEKAQKTWTFCQTYFMSHKYDIMSGLTVALAQVPEAVAFSFVAGLNPSIGLTAAWIMGVVTSLAGGRPGMISGATGATAVVMPSLINKYNEDGKNEGAGAVFYMVMFAGLIQISCGLAKCGKALKLISPPVMIGFVNGLAIVIGLAQLESFRYTQGLDTGSSSDSRRRLNAFGVFTKDTHGDPRWLPWDKLGYMFILVAITMVVTLGLPKLTSKVPSALCGIATSALVEWAIFRPLNVSTRLVKDVAGSVGGEFPLPIWAQDYNLPDLDVLLGDGLFWKTAIVVAVIGLVESLLTLNLIDELTETQGDRNRECMGQGLAQVIAGFLGGMGGCAMIGQSMINIKSGGRGRTSGLVAGIFTLIIVLAAYPLIDRIPVASLVGVMFCVVFHTFEWSSLKLLLHAALPLSWRTKVSKVKRKIHRFDILVILVVTVLTLFFDLAVAVACGVLLQCLGLAWVSERSLHVLSCIQDDGSKIYEVIGPLTFCTAPHFLDLFANYRDDPDTVEVHFQRADLHGFAAINALNTLGDRYSRVGKVLKIRHIKPAQLAEIRKASGLVKDSVEFQVGEEIEIAGGAMHLHVEMGTSKELRRRHSGEDSEPSRSASNLRDVRVELELKDEVEILEKGQSKRFEG